ADALVSSESLAAQVRAQQDLVDAATRAEALARARYDAGVDSHLVRLDAQRTLYSAQQALVATRLAEQANRVTLYRVLGGGWREDTAPVAWRRPRPETDQAVTPPSPAGGGIGRSRSQSASGTPVACACMPHARCRSACRMSGRFTIALKRGSSASTRDHAACRSSKAWRRSGCGAVGGRSR